MTIAGRTNYTSPDDELIAGDFPLLTKPVTIASGQNLVRGAVVGRVTASGEYVLSAAAANDGSQTIAGVLAFPVNATGGAAQGVIYEFGEFRADLLTFGAGHSAATMNLVRGLSARTVRASA